MNESQVAVEVRVSAGRLARVIEQRQQIATEELRQTISRLEPLIDQLRKDTIQGLQKYLACGSPSSMLQIIGFNHLEKPFNRILKWLADERAEHGIGREFLLRLCAHPDINFEAMENDLNDCDLLSEESKRIEIYGEGDSIDLSGNQPDLIILTPNAGLMFENKVNAAESGSDQYAKYLQWFPPAAKRQKRNNSLTTLCVLSARDPREVPPGWDRFISHKHLAEVLHEVAKAPGIPIWGRIAAIQCAVTLESSAKDEIAELIRVTRNRRRISISDWEKILSFSHSATRHTPWEIS